MKTVKRQKFLLDHYKELALAGKFGTVIMAEIFSKLSFLWQYTTRHNKCIL
jgi:hypothetical protein